MYDVLLPVDDDVSRGEAQATYVASLPDAEEQVHATVLRIVEPDETVGTEMRGDLAGEGPSPGPGDDSGGGDIGEFADYDAAVAAAEELESAGISVSRRLEGGAVSATVHEVAEEVDARNLVMGGRKRSGLSEVLLGSTVRDVFLSADRPVTITGAAMDFEGQAGNVLVPVDTDAERARHQAEYVTELPGSAAEYTATVLYVFRHQDYEGAPPHEFDEVDAAVETADRLEEAGMSVNRVAVGGEIVSKILDVAADHDVQGIVLAGRKRSGVQKVLMGSTARDVLLSADRPVTLTG